MCFVSNLRVQRRATKKTPKNDGKTDRFLLHFIRRCCICSYKSFVRWLVQQNHHKKKHPKYNPQLNVRYGDDIYARPCTRHSVSFIRIRCTPYIYILFFFLTLSLHYNIVRQGSSIIRWGTKHVELYNGLEANVQTNLFLAKLHSTLPLIIIHTHTYTSLSFSVAPFGWLLFIVLSYSWSVFPSMPPLP